MTNNGTAPDETKQIVDWPTQSFPYWWMRFRAKPRAKEKYLLVQLTEIQNREFIEVFQADQSYSKSIVKGWNAKFKPCLSPPNF